MTTTSTDHYPFNEALFNEHLSCVVYKLSYDFKTKLGILTMSTESCCDMDGCISLFKAIDPAITKIKTYAGETPDTVYTLSNNKWKAKSPNN